MNILQIHRIPFLTSFALLASLWSAQAAGPVVVFEDDFEYENEAALDAAYPIFQTAGGNPVTLGTTVAGGIVEPKYMTLNNVIVERSIGTTVNDSWTLSYQVMSNNYSRYSWIAFTNAAGTGGYAVSWNTGLATNYDGKGYVTIQRLDAAPTSWSDSTMFTALSSNVNSGHIASTSNTETPPTSMATITLSWIASTGELTMSVDGDPKATVTDTTYDSFSHLYVKGNGAIYYDNLLITVPEPSTTTAMVGIFALLICLGIRFRRKSARN